MFSKINSFSTRGIDGYRITVEVDVSNGLPSFVMVGYLAEEVREAQERVRTALRNAGFCLPPKRITVNLSPAGVRKEGTGCDLAIAAGILRCLWEQGEKAKIRKMLDLGWKRVDSLKESSYKCCINTELNSTNFLIGDEGEYLIDWEKPLYGDPAQDLGHFLAPTTTFWKTDVILTQDQIEQFIDAYLDKVGGRFDVRGLRERVHVYIPITCLRGITWCAMAWIEYQNPEKAIFNESTFRKLEAYLDDQFLDNINEIIK